jgi:hypothetical protein
LKAGLEDLRRKPVGRVRDLNPAKSFEAIGIITKDRRKLDLHQAVE